MWGWGVKRVSKKMGGNSNISIYLYVIISESALKREREKYARSQRFCVRVCTFLCVCVCVCMWVHTSELILNLHTQCVCV